jgi:undecaprenyl-diphosphatase
MGIVNSEAANAYAICIQAGAIAAVLWVYHHRFQQILSAMIGRDERGRRLAVNLIVAFVPAAVVGLLLGEQIEQRLFGLWPVVAAWFVGGLAILIQAWWQQGRSPRTELDLDSLTWQLALVIGAAQCLALWPGISRSLATIIGGVLIGLSLPAAVEFTFLLGVVTLGAATVYKGIGSGPSMLVAYGWVNLIVGFVVATVSAVVAVKWMIGYVQRRGLALFGYYRLLLAAAVGGLMVMGIL